MTNIPHNLENPCYFKNHLYNLETVFKKSKNGVKNLKICKNKLILEYILKLSTEYIRVLEKNDIE